MRRGDPIKKEPQIPPYARQRPLRRASPRRVLLPETETESSRRHALREAGFPLHGDGLARLDPDLASLSWKTRPSGPSRESQSKAGGPLGKSAGADFLGG